MNPLNFVSRRPIADRPAEPDTPVALENVSFSGQPRRTAGLRRKARVSLPLLFGALSLAGCTRSHPAAAAPDLPPARVQAVTARVTTFPAVISITGSVRPVQHAVLSAKVMGAVVELPVVLGQTVHRGEPLVQLAAGEISARVLQAQSQLNLARRDLDRERDLLAKGASTADMVKGLEDRFAMTQAMVGEARAMLAYTDIRAPFDGVIVRKFTSVGDLASPGMPLLELEGTGVFEVEAEIPDILVQQLAPGTTLPVTVNDVAFRGPLAELSPSADPMAHTVTAKIAVPAGTAVRSGQFARVEVPGAPTSALYLPSGAVTSFGQMERVFVVGGGNQAVLRLVRTGATRGSAVEILSGVDDGERVVVPVPAGLQEGQHLEIE